MRNRLVAIKYFYRECTIYHLIFTTLSLNIFLDDNPSIYAYIFWTKVIGYAFTFGIYQMSRHRYFYFFYNLHVGKTFMLMSSIVLDVILMILLMLIIQLIVN
ncbi:MAG: hypothetical protein KI790_07545 [Cyclobacteriaceae bacterium]|nr:hypothetical protein [Cyclobacteriaceae bacterium HetDA_MAG_MS6]